MTLLLRWFKYDGVRHCAYFRYREDGTRDGLVIAGPHGHTEVPDVPADNLHDLSDEILVELAHNAVASLGAATDEALTC